MAKMDKALHELLKQQWQEGNDDLQRRVPKWATLYRYWRGLFSYQDEDSERTGVTAAFDTFYRDVALDVEDPDVDYETAIFIRLTYQHSETVLSHIEEAFTAPPKPFELSMPRVWTQIPADYREFHDRRMSLYGATEMMVNAYKMNGSCHGHNASLRDMCIFGTGFTYHRQADRRRKGTPPTAVIERVRPWMLRGDPLAESIKDAKFVILERRKTQNEIIRLFPEAKQDIEGDGGLSDSESEMAMNEDKAILQRKELRVMEYWTWLDYEHIEEFYNEDDLQDTGQPELMRILVLGNDSGPSDVVLQVDRAADIYSCNEIPIQEYSFLRSPTEQGFWGIGIANLIEEDQVAMNTFFQRMVDMFGYQTQQGGFYDSALKEKVETPLRKGVRPGEWIPVDIGGGKEFEKAVFPLAKLYGSYTQDHLQLLQVLNLNPSRTTAVNDQNSTGLSTETFSNTAREAELLAQSGNRKFKMYANATDPQMKRCFTQFAMITADALRDAEVIDGQVYFYMDAQDKFYAIHPEVFDEPWEVRLLAGSTWVSDQAKANEILALAQTFLAAGDVQRADKLLRRYASIKNYDPDDIGEPEAALAEMMGMPPGAGMGPAYQNRQGLRALPPAGGRPQVPGSFPGEDTSRRHVSPPSAGTPPSSLIRTGS